MASLLAFLLLGHICHVGRMGDISKPTALLFLNITPLIFSSAACDAYAKIFGSLELVTYCTYNGVAYPFEHYVFAMMVVPLQAQQYIVLPEQFKNGHCLLHWHVARANLRIVGV